MVGDPTPDTPDGERGSTEPEVERLLQAQAEALTEARARLAGAARPVGRGPDPEAIAERIAALTNELERARHELETLKAWRAARLGMALGGGLRGLLGLPRRIWRAIRTRVAAPPPPLTVDPLEIITEFVGSKRWGARIDFPWFRVLYAGGHPPTFDHVATHIWLPQDAEHTRELIDDGADMLVIEQPAAAQVVLQPDVMKAIRAAGIPIVLVVRTADDLGFGSDVDVVLVEDPSLLSAATTALPDTRVLPFPPSVDDRSVNPIGWAREPDGTAVLIAPDPAVPFDLGDDYATLVAPLKGDLVVHGDPEHLDRRLRAFARPQLTSPAAQADIAKDYTVAIAARSMYASDSDFVRAVMTLAASGTPVVTTGSPLLEEVLPPTAYVRVESAADTKKIVKQLTNDRTLRERLGVAARRIVLRDHSTRVRFEHLVEAIGLPHPRLERVTILLSTIRPHNMPLFFENVRRQRFPDKELMLILHGDGFDDEVLEAELAKCDFPVTVTRRSRDLLFGDCLNAALEDATGSYVTKMDDDDWYGPHHLTDLVLAHRYSGADVVGKPAGWIHLEGPDKTLLRRTWPSEQYVSHVAGGTLFMTRDLARRFMFERRALTLDATLYKRVRAEGGRVFSTHPFDYLLVRHGKHTWQVDDQQFIDDAREIHDGLRRDLAAHPDNDDF